MAEPIFYLATHQGRERLPGVETLIPEAVLREVERRSHYGGGRWITVVGFAWDARQRWAYAPLTINSEMAADPLFDLWAFISEEVAESFEHLGVRPVQPPAND